MFYDITLCQNAASLVVSLTIFNQVRKPASRLHTWNHTEDQGLRETGYNFEGYKIEGTMCFTFEIPPENEYPSNLTPA